MIKTGFGSFLARRTVNLLILLLLVALFNFFLFRIMPGDVISLLVDPRLKPESKDILRHNLGLDQPYINQVGTYIVNLFTFNFGNSFFSHRPVWVEIFLRLPATLYLIGLAAFLSIILGVTTGIFAASRRGRTADVSVVTSSIFLGSLPTFWMGLLFILVFSYYLSNTPFALPSYSILGLSWTYATLSSNFAGFIADSTKHLILPLLTLTVFLFGGYTLLMRNTFVGVLSEDFILTAKAKGLANRDVLYKHALGNAVLPLVTTIALAFGAIISGAALTETVFNWNGLGSYIVVAVGRRDWPVLQGVFFLVAITTVLANFIADIVYAALDPRVRL